MKNISSAFDYLPGGCAFKQTFKSSSSDMIISMHSVSFSNTHIQTCFCHLGGH